VVVRVGRDSRRSRLVIAGLLVLAFVLVTIDFHSRDSGSGVRGLFQGVFGGAESAVTAATRPIGRTASSLTHPNRYHNRADDLARQNAELRRQLAQDAAVKRAAAELAALRLVADQGQYTILPARVVAVGDVTGTNWNVTINAGTADGVRADSVVLNADGLVGTVISATGHSAIVRLVCDPDSHIGARLEKTQLLGAVSGGQGPDTLTFTLYDATHKVSVGDRLVTFGSIDYAAGVPIGVVTKVLDTGAGLSRSAQVRTFVSVGSLDLVGVVVGKPPTDPGDRLLKPRPVPAPPPTTAPPPAPATQPTGQASGQPAAASPGGAQPSSAAQPVGAAQPSGGPAAPPSAPVATASPARPR
jgi:rod shape-determining protein MreC